MAGCEVGRTALERVAVMVFPRTQSRFDYVSLGFRLSVWCYFVCYFSLILVFRFDCYFPLFWCLVFRFDCYFSLILSMAMLFWVFLCVFLFYIFIVFLFFRLNGWEIRKAQTAKLKQISQVHSAQLCIAKSQLCFC